MRDNPYQSPSPSQPPRSTLRYGGHLLVPLISFLGTVVLISAVLHVHSDRSKSRQPIVTYVGPLSSWMPQLVYLGLGLSLLGFVLAIYLLHRDREQVPSSPSASSAALAMGVAMFNAMASFIAYAAIWED